MRLPEVRETEPLEKRFPRMSSPALDLMKVGDTVTRVEGNEAAGGEGDRASREEVPKDVFPCTGPHEGMRHSN